MYASTRLASTLRPGATMLGAAWRRSATLSCRSRERAGVAVAGPRCRWNGWPSDRRPEPSGQRQLGMVDDGPGGHRGLSAAAGAFPGARLGSRFPGFGRATARADKALRPTRGKQVCHAGGFIREVALKLDQGVWKIGHGGSPCGVGSLFVLTPFRPRRYNILRFQDPPGCSGISLIGISITVPRLLWLITQRASLKIGQCALCQDVRSIRQV